MTKERKKLIRSLDDIWRKAVTKDGKCKIPGCTYKCTKPQAHHIVTRSVAALRWKLDNGISLCPSHHTLGLYSAHKNPAWFTEAVEKAFPGRVERLNLQRNNRLKMSEFHLAILKQELLKEVEGLT